MSDATPRRDLPRLRVLPAPLATAQAVSPCVANACRACCMDTEMPLLDADVVRLAEATGRDPAAFSVRDPGTGETRLRNVDGACIFLGSTGCTVYDDRPAGCRLYPLVWDEAPGRGVLDDDCPYRDGFRVRPRDRAALAELVAALTDP